MRGKKRLGRGLEALLGGSGDKLKESEEVHFKYLPVSEIKDNPYQVRLEERVDDLLPSIKKYGIIEPLVVRRTEEGYVLIAGARRLKAARILKLAKVPVYIVDVEDKEAMALTLIENLKREDLSPIEMALGYKRLMEEFGMKEEEIASLMGKDRSTISNTLRLLKLSKYVQKLLIERKLQEGHARPLIGLPEDVQNEIADRIINEKLAVRDVEALVREIKRGFKRKFRKQKLVLTSKKLNLPVIVEQGRRTGKVVIKFRTQEELEKLKRILDIGGD